jgi:hypothetical protein
LMHCIMIEQKEDCQRWHPKEVASRCLDESI